MANPFDAAFGLSDERPPESGNAYDAEFGLTPAAPAAPAVVLGGNGQPTRITVRPPSPEGSDDKINAFTGGFIRDIPIIGPSIETGAQNAAAGIRSLVYGTPFADERKAVSDYANAAKEENPATALAGGITGNITAMAPIGMTAIGARALGAVGPNLATRAGFGATSGAAIGGADAAVRGNDPTTGAIVGAVVGGAIPTLSSTLRRIVSPLRPTQARQAQTQVLDREGVELTAGDRSGSKPLRWFEETIGDMPAAGGITSELKDRQGRQFTAAVLRRAGINADLATPAELQAASDRLGNVFETLSARNTLQYDQQFANELTTALNRYGRKLNSLQRPIFDNILNDIIQAQGRMSGAQYQAARSDLSRMAKGLRNSDPILSDALQTVRNALDDAMDRSIIPADQGAWEQARRQWSALRTIEKAASGAGERTAEGYLSPSQVRNAVAGNDRRAYAQGRGDLAELSRAGEAILKPLPNSGTAQRNMMQHILTALGGGGGFFFSGGNPLAAAAGFLAPGILARLLLARPAQRVLSNQAAGPGFERGANILLQGAGREIVQQPPWRPLDQLGAP